jgi:hypothetical protein
MGYFKWDDQLDMPAHDRLGLKDGGGLTGLPVDLSTHQIKSGRMYRYHLDKKEMAAASDWIRV